MAQFLPYIVSAFLAWCGWVVISRIANRREAYDLCGSLLRLMERLEEETSRAWKHGRVVLDEYTDKRLLAYVSRIELELNILEDHYHKTNVDRNMIAKLRRLATYPSSTTLQREDRQVQMQTLVIEISDILLRSNYRYINKWRLLISIRKRLR